MQKAKAAEDQCDKDCDTTCKASTSWTEITKRAQCKKTCKAECVKAIANPADLSNNNKKSFPWAWVIVGVLLVAIIVILIVFRKRIFK